MKNYQDFENYEFTNLVEEPQITIDLKNRTKHFAYKCYELCEMLPKNYAGLNIRYQLFKASSSVGANYRATCCAQSKKAFIAKISIVIEETDECSYWLDFIYDNKILNNELLMFLKKEAKELAAIFNASRKTASANLKNKVN